MIYFNLIAKKPAKSVVCNFLTIVLTLKVRVKPDIKKEVSMRGGNQVELTDSAAAVCLGTSGVEACLRMECRFKSVLNASPVADFVYMHLLYKIVTYHV